MRDVKQLAGGTIKGLLERGESERLPDSLLPQFIEPAVTIGYVERASWLISGSGVGILMEQVKTKFCCLRCSASTVNQYLILSRQKISKHSNFVILTHTYFSYLLAPLTATDTL